MSEQYYQEHPTSAHATREVEITFQGRSFRFWTDAGVFSKGDLDDGSRLLAEDCLQIRGSALDFGCGWGPVGICIASMNQEVRFTFTDVNTRAVELCRRNLRKNDLFDCQVLQGDGLGHIEDKFDHILLNPPIRAGKQVIYRLFEEAKEHLSPNGELHIVMMTRQGADSAKRQLETMFSEVEITSRGSGYKVMRCRDGSKME